VAAIRAVNLTVRDLIQQKWKLSRLFFGAAFLLSLRGMIMKQSRLSLFTIDLKYVRNLANHDKTGNVRSISPQIGKSARPFLGVIVICDNKQYCVPLSSPREKHKK